MEDLANNKIEESFNRIFSDKEILITGATGLTGKAIVEKILRSIPTVKKIYILVRAKKNKTCEERMVEYKKHKIFDRLYTENPNGMDKLFGIEGDIEHIGLGLSPESIEIIKNVSFIYHCAATVRFDEELRKAFFLNVRGTLEMLNFATKLKKLELFVHVSTMYSNPKEYDVKERLYPAKADWRTMLKCAETYDDVTLNSLTPKILQDFPNSYTFTKHLAEHVANEYRNKIPVVIARPSIITSSLEEPYPGWYDSYNGIVGLIAAINTGIVRNVYCNGSTVLDPIPLDIVVKMTLFYTWYHLNIGKETEIDEVSIANLTTAFYRRTCINALAMLDCESIKDKAFNKTLWPPNFGITKNIKLFYLQFYLFNLLPSVFLDILLKIFGYIPFMVHLQRRSLSTQLIVHFFAFNDFQFEHTKVMNFLPLMAQHPDFSLENACKSTFREHVDICIIGVRRYLLNEDDSSLPAAKKRLRIMSYLDWAIKNFFLSWVVYKSCFYIATLVPS